MKASRIMVLMVLVVGMVAIVSADTDGYESGAYDDGNPITWSDISEGSASTSVSSSDSYEGSYSLQISPTSSEDAGVRYSTGGLDLQDNHVVSAWMKAKNSVSYNVEYTLANDGNLEYADGDEVSMGFGFSDFRFNSYDSNGNSIDGGEFSFSGHPNAGEWYFFKMKFNKANNNVDIEVYDSNKNLLGTKTFSYSGSTTYDYIIHRSIADRGNTGLADLSCYNLCVNNPPKFNSSSVSPDPPLIGENVSYSAEVYDPDGSIDYTNLTVSYGGTEVVSDAQRTGTTPSWNDVFTPQTGDKWLNATFTAVDDAGATTTEEVNRFLSNDAPTVSLSEPSGEKWSYSNPVEFSLSDSDSKPDEVYSCTGLLDGGQVFQETLYENGSMAYSSSVDADLGNHSFEVSCSDQDGNTDSSNTSFNVKAFEQLSKNSDSEVFETENVSYTSQYKTGEMVNSLTSELLYDGKVVDTDSVNPSGVSSFTVFNYHEIPLVQSNETSKNWSVRYSADYTGFDGSNTQDTRNSGNSSQNVLWSYYLEDSFTDPEDGRYIEGGELRHSALIHTETDKASVSGITEYKRNGETSEMVLESGNGVNETWTGSLGVGRADSFNQSVFKVQSDLTVEFKEDSREISTPESDVEVNRIRLSDDSTESNVAEALQFNTFYEGSQGDSIDTDLSMDLTVSKNGISRDFSYITRDQSTHSFYIRPSWAEYEISTSSDDLIQYEKSDGEGVLRSYFFPEGELINNNITEVPLLNINRSETTRIQFEVTDSSGAPADGVVCRVDRKFPGTGESKTVFMIKTGSEGNTESFAEVNEIYYRFTCYEDGEVIDVLSDQIMNNPMRIRLGEEERESSLNYNRQFDASCETTETSLDCSYQSDTDTLNQARLLVERREVMDNQVVCDKTGASRTGSLSCQDLNFTENTYEYTVTGDYTQASVIGDSGVVGVDSGIDYGFVGILATIMIYGLITIAASKNMLIGLGVGTSWILVSSILGFFPMTPEMRASLVALTMVIGWVISK